MTIFHNATDSELDDRSGPRIMTPARPISSEIACKATVTTSSSTSRLSRCRERKNHRLDPSTAAVSAGRVADESPWYPWLVVGAAFCANAIIYGIAWSVGVFHELFADQFGTGSGVTALMTSLNTSLMYGSGPVSALLTNRFGFRRVSMAGGLVAAVGLAASSLADSVHYLLITFGICTGFGFGLSFIPFSAVIGAHFDGRRRGVVALAFGIAAAGTGVGWLAGGVVLRRLINWYGWRGAVLLAGAVCAQLCVLGALLRPRRRAARRPSTEGDKDDVEEDSSTSSDRTQSTEATTCAIDKSLFEIPTSDKSSTQDVSRDVSISSGCCSSSKWIRLLRLDIFSSRWYVLLCFNNVLMCFGLSVIYVHLIAYACSGRRGQAARQADGGGGVGGGGGLGDDCDRDEAALLLTVVGGANLAGRIFFCTVACLRPRQMLPLYSFALLVSGLATCVSSPLFEAFGYRGLVGFSALFGLSSACIGPLLPPLIISFLDAASLASGYGYLLVFEAVGQFLGAPVAGWLYDATGVYSSSFYLAGSTLVASAVIMLLPWGWDAVRTLHSDVSRPIGRHHQEKSRSLT